MKLPDDRLVTPIYLKLADDQPWPDDPVFYQLTADGLYLCRNHPFFQSSVPVERFPSELARHDSFLKLFYPKVPRRLFELVVGFFDRVGRQHGAEAAVLLAWDRKANRIRLVVPEQLATVSMSWGEPYPLNVKYETPDDLPADWTIIGDVHSHVDEPAYSSGMDRDDEEHRPGIHVVVGKLLRRDPPDVHVEAVVDGNRFRVPQHLVIDGYRKRRTGVPQEWLDRVKVKVKSYWSSYSTSSGSSSGGGYWNQPSGSRYGGSYSDNYPADSYGRSGDSKNGDTSADRADGGPKSEGPGGDQA